MFDITWPTEEESCCNYQISYQSCQLLKNGIVPHFPNIPPNLFELCSKILSGKTGIICV